MSFRKRIKTRLSTIIAGKAPRTAWIGSDVSRGTEYSLSDYRAAFEKDDLAQYCITLLAQFSTLKGFETKIKTLDGSDPQDHKDIKAKIDRMNQKVNLDQILYLGQIKRYIYGFAGFEILWDDEGYSKLIPLKSEFLSPKITKDYKLEGFKYYNTETLLPPHRVFFLTTDDLDYDGRGLSKMKPIMRSLETRYDIREDLRQTAKRIWAPTGIFQIDTSGMTEEEEAEFLNNFSQSVKPGQSIITNQSIQADIVRLTPDLSAFVNVLSKIEEEIIGNFGIPKALVSREKSLTKATLEFALRALYEGPIKGIQQYLRREVESQLYQRVIDELDMTDQIRVLHKWKPISMLDYASLAEPIATLVKNSVIDVPTAWNILDLDLSYLRRIKRGPVQSDLAFWVEEE